MINEIRREFSIVPDFSMFVDFNHDRFRIAIVALRPVFAVGNAAFDFWHMITPCPQLARCKEGVFLPNWVHLPDRVGVESMVQHQIHAVRP